MQIFGFSTEILVNFLYLVNLPWEILMKTVHVEKLASGFNFKFPLYSMFLHPLKIIQGYKMLRTDKRGNT